MFKHMPKNQSGYSIAIVFAALLIITGIGLGGLYVAKNQHKTKATQPVVQPKQAQSKKDTTNPSEPTASPSPQQYLKNKSDTDALINYMSVIIASVEEYAANNNGNLPATLDPIMPGIKETHADYYTKYSDWKTTGPITKGTPAATTLYYGTGYTCDYDSNLMVSSSDKRFVAITVLLPTGKAYCVSA